MAGGTFDPLVGKVRPGTYINFESTRNDIINNNSRGITLIPLIGHNYGPSKEFFSIYSSAPDSAFSKLGMSVYDDNDYMLLIREAFKNAKQVIAYIIGPDKKASATGGTLTATAKYGGTLGNNMELIIEANPNSGFDVSVYLNESRVFYQEGAETVAKLSENDYVDWTGEGELTATAGIKFTGGSDATITNKDYTDFLDATEKAQFNVACCPITDSAIHTAIKTKVKYYREDVGRKVQFVIPDFAADYEGIINVTNSVVVDDKELTHAQACAYVAGLTAAADEVTSNTYAAYDDATDIVDEKTHEEAVAAINNGEFFFSKDSSGNVVVEYDINSLVTFTDKKDKSYRKNKVIRVFDSFSESVLLNFPPNKYANDEEGWDIMEGQGKKILQRYLDKRAIKNVDFDNDFKVDRSSSKDDETYFIIGLQAVDMSEKLFFTIKTN
ncbi:MAG: phage tail sheath subtilisin-like domain-containing protein [Clostridia bacterium]|nr:phage tail sheath subtilisin-like domain-containing protein [Clostridia bacterium]